MLLRGCKIIGCLTIACIFLPSVTHAQLTADKLESLKAKLHLLESTREDVTRLLAEDSFHVSSDGQVFYREDETINVTYSSGDCDEIDDDSTHLPADIWNVSAGVLVDVSIRTKDSLTAKDLGISLSRMKKERPFRGHKNYFIYFDKDAGEAVYVMGGYVESVHFFPSRQFSPKLCPSPLIRKYFPADKWRIRAEPKDNTVDFNWPSKVVNVQLIQPNTRQVTVVVTAEDPENDPLLYLYKISAGRIVGTGAKVTWDLSNVPPGTYTITAAVDDGMGPVGRFITKSITIK